MKKLIIISIILLLVLLGMSNEKEVKEEIKKEEEIRAIFISYIELSEYISNDIKTSKENVNKMINNIKSTKANTIILQVRICADSIYDSKIFPYSMYVSNSEGEKSFDILSYFIKVSHKNNIKLIAWINPYRVRTTNDINSISEKSPAYKYIGTDYLYVNNGIFFNPSKKEVEDLIVSGVEEVLDYSVDGVIFDDYFYPSNDVDYKDYEEYIKNNKEISKEEYNLSIINHLVLRVHELCKKKNVKFGISPEGNIENNYSKNYADVRKWLENDKYIDFIMPQIYYGFYNSSKAYTDVIKEWESLLKTDNIDFLVALAFYKVGKIDQYAKDGINEWIDNNDIIMREVILSRNLKNYKGFSLFRYDNLFNTINYTETSKNELENLKKVLE